LYGKSKIEDLEKETKCRVMDASEVGHAFDLRLLGAIKVVFSKAKNFTRNHSKVSKSKNELKN
jgi:hypothetical protein